MTDHGIGFQQFHAVDHVLAIGFEGGIRSLPCVAAIKEQYLVVTAIGPDGLDQCCRAVESAKLAIGFGQIKVVVHCMRIGERTARLDAEMFEKFLSDKMRRNALKSADTDIGVWRPEVDRLKLRMHIGKMQKGNLALGVELQKSSWVIFCCARARVRFPENPLENVTASPATAPN